MLLCEVLFCFPLIDVTKYETISNLREEWFALAWSSFKGTISYVWEEMAAGSLEAGHTASAVKKQRGLNTDARKVFSFIQSMTPAHGMLQLGLAISPNPVRNSIIDMLRLSHG